MKYFMVTCNRGHRGCGKFTDIKFAVAAKDLITACNIARNFPSVKHTKPMLYGKEITKEQYIEYRRVSAYERAGY